jgi:hypothetical protein
MGIVNATIEKVTINNIPLHKEECPHCKFLDSIFRPISEMPDKTNREYWIFTEMFVYLHDGKDYCNYRRK